MSFEVVGFFKPNLSFSMGAGALENVCVDYNIVMPYFIPAYAPSEGDITLYIHIAELISGYMPIAEPIEEINDSTHSIYMDKIEEIATRHNLSGIYMSPIWPVGFVFSS